MQLLSECCCSMACFYCCVFLPISHSPSSSSCILSVQQCYQVLFLRFPLLMRNHKKAKPPHIDRNNILVQICEDCEIASVPTAMQTIVEQQVLSKIPDCQMCRQVVESEELLICEHLNCSFVKGHSQRIN